MFCHKPTLITPSFSEIERIDLTIPPMEIALPPPKYEEVEVLYVPFWMLLLQGVQFAIVFMVLMYVLYGGKTYLEKEREAEAYEALREKEKENAIFIQPELSRIEQFKNNMRLQAQENNR